MKRDVKFTTLTELAKQRLMDLVYQRRDLGSFGLGSARSVEVFAKHSGINYSTKSIVQPYQEGPTPDAYGQINLLHPWPPNFYQVKFLPLEVRVPRVSSKI
jgi:hypothetical protein